MEFHCDQNTNIAIFNKEVCDPLNGERFKVYV